MRRYRAPEKAMPFSLCPASVSRRDPDEKSNAASCCSPPMRTLFSRPCSRPADVNDMTAVKIAMAGVDIVVNTCGPYFRS